MKELFTDDFFVYVKINEKKALNFNTGTIKDFDDKEVFDTGGLAKEFKPIKGFHKDV